MPGLASRCVGTTGSDLQATRIRRRLDTDTSTKDLLAAEYCEAVGLPKQPVSKKLVDAAVLYMHKSLLRGVCPPWFEYDFPQALPAEKVLPRYTRPSSLQWRKGT